MSKSTDFFSIGWLLAGISVSALFGVFMPDRRFLPGFADGLMVAGASLLAIAWLLHLRADGLWIVPRRSKEERLPEPGNAPTPIPPLPGADGPGSEAYKKLEEAERKLRERIAGADSGSETESRDLARKSSFRIVVSGGTLFVLSLVLQYLVPLLSAP